MPSEMNNDFESIDPALIPTENLGLSTRSYHCMMAHGYRNLASILELSESDISSFRNMGHKSVSEILALQEACKDPAFLHRLYVGSSHDLATMPGESTQELTQEDIERQRKQAELEAAFREHVQTQDVDIAKLPLPVRAVNALVNAGYSKFSEIIGLTRQELASLPRSGALTVDAIAKYIDECRASFAQAEEHKAYYREHPEAITDESMDEVMLKHIQSADYLCGISEIASQFPETMPQERIQARLEALVNEGRIRHRTVKEAVADSPEDDIGAVSTEHASHAAISGYAYVPPTFASLIPLLKNENQQFALRGRIADKTLEEVGEEAGVTRERIRQLQVKGFAQVQQLLVEKYHITNFEDERYRYLFETYGFTKQQAETYLGFPEGTWFYLSTVTKHGDRDLDEALTDEAIEPEFRQSIAACVAVDNIVIGHVSIPKKRAALERYVLSVYCRQDVTIEEYYRLFNQFLREHGFPEGDPLYVTDENFRARIVRTTEMRCALWQNGQVLRFYDIDARDYGELFDTLALDQYDNTEISTAKLIRDYPDLMREYDIDDPYELHNLLRKLEADKLYPKLQFGRMPMLKFGVFDRDKAVYDILRSISPATTDELAEAISEAYGIDVATVKANWLKSMTPYYHQGVYRIDYEYMPAYQLEKLRKTLTEDLYGIKEIEDIYTDLFSDADASLISPLNLTALGFTVYSTYVLRGYPSVDAYMQHVIETLDTFDIRDTKWPRHLPQVAYNSILKFREDYTVAEYGDHKYVTSRGLAKLGITRSDIARYVDSVYEIAKDMEVFTIESLKGADLPYRFVNCSYGNWFYASLLRADPRFSSLRIGNNILLKADMRKSKLRFPDFVISLINRQFDGVARVQELQELLEQEYGLHMDTHKLRAQADDMTLAYDIVEDSMFVV